MFRKIAQMTAVVAAVILLGATSAHALDDDQVRFSQGFPIWIDSGVYGYDSTSGQWMVWDLYQLPNGQTQRLCHPAGKSSPKTAC